MERFRHFIVVADFVTVVIVLLATILILSIKYCNITNRLGIRSIKGAQVFHIACVDTRKIH